ncbi:MAG: DNA/RNA nuclease SfsA [Lachnospirales bacterium]
MIYSDILMGTFIERPNRFIAKVKVNNKIETVHVKNTGRCKELLTKNATVILEKSNNPNRKTNFSLIAVYKNDLLINMDSQVPNKVVYDAINENIINFDVIELKHEVTYKNSRFDIYFKNTKANFLEVKGVTLEENGVAMFPDAVTTRGKKHLLELLDAKENGYGAYVLFLIQFKNPKYFTPNIVGDPEFSKTLKYVHSKGVDILVYDSIVTDKSIVLGNKIDFKL